MGSKKIRIVSIALALVLMLTLVAGCAGEAPAPTPETRTIIDQAGRAVEIPKDVRRIVCVPVVLPPLIYAIDGTGERVVGMHPVTMSAVENSVLSIMAPELLNASTGFVAGGFKVNVEELLKLEPDVVFEIRTEMEEIEKMEAVGLPVLATHGGGLQENLEFWLNMLGEVLGKEQRAAELLAYFHETLDMISSKVSEIPAKERPNALILFHVEELRACGQGSFAPFWLETTGAINVASGIETSPRGTSVNMEQILVWNPNIIYITNFCETQPADILENKIEGQDWSEVKAVKGGRVYKIPLGEYRWYPPSADAPLMLKWLAQKHHPELFADYDIEEEIREHFLSVHHFELSDVQVEKILHPEPTGVWRWD